MKKILLCMLVAVSFFTLDSFAVPARPVKHLLTQPDGSTLEVYLRGDEFLHYYVTADHVLLQQAEDGYWKYATLGMDGSIIAGNYIAKNPVLRSNEEQNYIKAIDKDLLNNNLRKTAAEFKTNRRKIAPGEIKKVFPTTGVVRGLVIMAQYQDIKFTEKATLEVYKDLISKDGYKGEFAAGSVRDYFVDQSGGLFTPEFDVVGPVTLPEERSFYGGGSLGGENVSQMVIDACLLADKDFNVDFSRYDSNGDGEVDFIYILYAGYNEAQNGPVESVWPQSGSLKYAYYKTIDGMYLGTYSCSSELRGNENEELDGIGTFCHEFSHILGLPDIYDTGYSDAPGLDYWDVMDIGSYNDNSKTPAGFTAMDKYTVGWLVPTVLEQAQVNVSLESLSSSNKAYFIVNPQKPTEYFTLENRQLEGWDAKLPGHGLLICHIDYNLGIWNSNRVNTVASGGHEHVMLVAADGNDKSGEPGDVFPGTTGKTSFMDNSKPAAVWWSKEKVGKPVRNIREENGVIYFDFISDGSGIEYVNDGNLKVNGSGNRINVENPSGGEVYIYTIDGRLYSAVNSESFSISAGEGVYVVKSGDITLKVCVKP